MKRCTLAFIAILLLTLGGSFQSAAAKDTWTSVRSKNFLLVGNASDKEIRRVASRLEQFRDVLGRLLNRANLASSTPTTVVVFKSQSAYQPFAPPGTAGYFQSGPDMNYISLSAEANSQDPHPFSVIFHEYVHFMIKNNMKNVPDWFNEGIAEYYSTLEVLGDDRKVQIGLPIGYHLQALREQKLLPFKTLLTVDHSSPYYNEAKKQGIFYAESWALVHYLMLGNDARRQPQLGKFLSLLLSNKPVDDAFQEAFQIDSATVEKELKEYINRHTFPGQVATFERKLEFDAEMQSAPLSEAEAQFYLGDLLLHAHQLDRAEKFLQQAVKLDPNLSMAEASLGMLYMRKNNLAAARQHLERAVGSSDTRNYLVHYYYAFVLSREGADDNDMVSGYAPETLEKLRAELKKTIELAPNFAEGYRLLAFIDLVAGNKMDEALALLQRAVALEPGEPQHKFMLAQLYMQKQDYKAARPLFESLVRTGEAELRAHAQQMLDVLSSIEARQASRNEETQSSSSSMNGNSSTETARTGDPAGPPRLSRRTGSGQPAAPQQQGEVSLNGPPGMQLRKPAPGEEQVRGLLVRIDCTDSNIVLTVRVGERLLKLQSAGLEDIEFVTYSPEVSGDMTCGTPKTENPVIVIYRPSKTARAKFDGDVLSVSFVTKEMLLEAGKE